MGKGRRFLQNSALHDLPVPEEGEKIVKVVAAEGNNTLQVEDGDGALSLCRIPNRFRGLIWVKPGDLVIAHYDTPQHPTDKIVGEMAHSLYKYQIAHLRAEGLLPERFQQRSEREVREEDSEQEEDILVNPNHAHRPRAESESEEDSE